MKQHQPDPMTAVDALSRAARAEADRKSSGAPPMDGWLRLERSLSERAPGAPGRRRSTRLVLAGIGAAVLAFGAYRLARPARIAYVVEGATAEAGYVHAVPAAGARMRFTDGSEVGLQGGSRCLVVGTDRNGARLRVEDGRARVHVAHRTGTHWSVEAGPFEVTVTGTEFDVAWSGADESFRLLMHSGSVDVRGPLPGGAVTLRAGHELSVDLRSKALSITTTENAPAAQPQAAAAPVPTALPPAAPGTATPAATPAVVTPPPAATRPARTGRKVALASPSSGTATTTAAAETAPPEAPVAFAPGTWSRQVATGKARDVVDQARAHGLAACLLELEAGQLSALADAARYTGDSSLARDVLTTQRRRFPQSEEAHRAAFFLGRMSDDVGVSPAEALRWYNRYLEEAPGGPYAAEALGRKMLALEKLAGREAARPVAQEYLRRFPNGPYMLQVRHIVDGT